MTEPKPTAVPQNQGEGEEPPRPPPPRNIVLCSDGTGNGAGKAVGTNVWRLYQAIDLSGSDQIAFHDDGVGSEDFKLFKILGGAFGWGLSRNIRELYTSLVRTYNPGDRIFLFGFSRGAFTVRSLAGLIDAAGVLERSHLNTPKDLEETVARLFKAYRARPGDALAQAIEAARGAGNEFHRAEITFLGLWDTVDAVGVPMDWLRPLLHALLHTGRHRAGLNESILHACHALAIDDERKTFEPVLLNEAGKSAAQSIEQVWFAGVHSNVGGGYAKDGMARVPLNWMMDKAEALPTPLRFAPAVREQYRHEANVYDRLYDSRAGLGAYYRVAARDIAALAGAAAAEIKIHESVFRRLRSRTEGYAPFNIPQAYHIDAAAGAGARVPPLAAREPLRHAATALAGAVALLRYPLYLALLATTLAVAGVVLWLGWEPAESAPAAGLQGALSAGIEVMLPALLARFLGPLVVHYHWLALFAGAFGVLFWLRGFLKTTCRDVAAMGWRYAFVPGDSAEAAKLQELIAAMAGKPWRAVTWSLRRVRWPRWLWLLAFLALSASGAALAWRAAAV